MESCGKVTITGWKIKCVQFPALLCFQFMSVTRNVRNKCHIWHSVCMHCSTSRGPSQALPRLFLRAVWWWELGWASSVVPGIFLSSVPVTALLYGASSWHSPEWCVTNPQIHPRAFAPFQHHSLGPQHPQVSPCLPLMMVTEGSAHKSCGLAPAASPFVVLLSFHCQLNGVFFPSPRSFCLHKTWCCIVNNVGIHYINFPLISSVFPAVMESEQSNLSSPTCQITLYPLSIRTNVCKPLKS